MLTHVFSLVTEKNIIEEKNKLFRTVKLIKGRNNNMQGLPEKNPTETKVRKANLLLL